MKNLKLRGSYTALVTPFRKGKVDYERFARQIEFQIANGTHGIVPCGTTGESPTLSHEEHKKVIAVAVEVANKRVPVIAGTGSNSTDEAVDLSRYAQKAGADAILNVVPYYNKPTQEGQYRHFKEIAVKARIPQVLYNIPGRCGTGLEVKTIERLAKIDEIIAIKEATGNIDMSSQILTSTDLVVLSGDDSLTLPLLSIGGSGVISVVSNLFPRETANLVNAFFEGHIGKAQHCHLKLFSLVKTLFIETNPIPVKTAMKILKMDSGEFRLPMCEMRPENEAVLAKALHSFQARGAR